MREENHEYDNIYNKIIFMQLYALQFLLRVESAIDCITARKLFRDLEAKNATNKAIH